MGFPTRINRNALGPKRRNRAPVRNHVFYLDANYVNLLMWQVAGMGVCTPRATALVDSDGTLLSSAEAWDPNALAVPTVAHPSTGVYTVTYPATVPNEDDTQITLDLVACMAIVQGTDPAIVAAQQVTSNRVAEVTIKNAGGLANAKFLLMVW